MAFLSGLRIGYGPLLKRIEESLQSSMRARAWILSGPRGVGKKTLAYSIADLFLSAHRDFSDSPYSSSFWNHTHPHCFVLPSAPSLTIIHETLRRVSLGHDRRQVVIVPQGEKLPLTSVNALLKALEKPFSETLFLITASRPLPLTLTSRACTFHFSPLPYHLFLQALEALNDLEIPISHPLFFTWAQGCLSRALSLKKTISFLEKAWFLCNNALFEKSFTIDPSWLAWTTENMTFFHELFVIWAHEVMKSLCSKERFFCLFQEVEDILSQHFIYHTDARVSLYSILGKISLFTDSYSLDTGTST